MATDTGIVIIYDLKNKGAPLTCHRTDAKEFLAHPSGRWSTSPDKKKAAIGDAKGEESGDDTGEAMKLKSMDYIAIKAMAKKESIPGYNKMKRAELVEALLAKTETADRLAKEAAEKARIEQARLDTEAEKEAD